VSKPTVRLVQKFAFRLVMDEDARGDRCPAYWFPSRPSEEISALCERLEDGAKTLAELQEGSESPLAVMHTLDLAVQRGYVQLVPPTIVLEGEIQAIEGAKAHSEWRRLTLHGEGELQISIMTEWPTGSAHPWFMYGRRKLRITVEEC